MRKNIGKRIIALALAGTMAMGLVACGGKDEMSNVVPADSAVQEDNTAASTGGSESGNSENSAGDEANAQWYLNTIELSDAPTIPSTNTTLFSTNWRVPFDTEMLKEISTDDKDPSKKLKDMMEKDSIKDHRTALYDTGRNSSCLLEITDENFQSGDDTTWETALTRGFWQITESYPREETMGIRIAESDERYSNVESDLLIVDALVAALGTPNVYVDSDVLLGNEDNIEVLFDRYFGNHEDEQICMNNYQLGWLTEDYLVTIMITESLMNGYHQAKVAGVNYIPTGNAVKIAYYTEHNQMAYVKNRIEQEGLQHINEVIPLDSASEDAPVVEETTIAEEEKEETPEKGSASSEPATDEDGYPIYPDEEGESNFVDADVDFSVDANENVFAMADVFNVIHRGCAITGTVTKGVFKNGDVVYIQGTNGRIIEATILTVEQFRKDIGEATEGMEVAIYVDRTTRHDVEHSTVVVTK